MIHKCINSVCTLWCITYQILRQSRPSLRRWTASSLSWTSPRRRLLPPAAAPLKTRVGRPDRGQHSAATSDYTTCRKTLGPNDATDQRGFSTSASQRTAPERDTAVSDATNGAVGLVVWLLIRREGFQSKCNAIQLAVVPGRANHQ